MVRLRFNLGSTLKILNLSLLRFNEWFGSKNLGGEEDVEKSYGKIVIIAITMLFDKYWTKTSKLNNIITT